MLYFRLMDTPRRCLGITAEKNHSVARNSFHRVAIMVPVVECPSGADDHCCLLDLLWIICLDYVHDIEGPKGANCSSMQHSG
jgi:hypothetical protein